MCLTFISVIEIIYLKKGKGNSGQPRKAFWDQTGARAAQNGSSPSGLPAFRLQHGKCQTCELPEIWPWAPLSLAENTEVAADPSSHQVRMLRGGSCLREKVTMVTNGSQVNKFTSTLKRKPACECNTSAAALSAPCWGQLWASLWAAVTPEHTPPCLGVQQGMGPTGPQLLTSGEGNPAGVRHENFRRWNLETQDPRGKHPFPKITSEGHWVPSATRSHMVCAILIPLPSCRCWILNWASSEATERRYLWLFLTLQGRSQGVHVRSVVSRLCWCKWVTEVLCTVSQLAPGPGTAFTAPCAPLECPLWDIFWDFSWAASIFTQQMSIFCQQSVLTHFGTWPTRGTPSQAAWYMTLALQGKKDSYR